MNVYKRHRFLPDIICYAVWLYYRFNLSQRDIEDLLAARGITISRKATHTFHSGHTGYTFQIETSSLWNTPTDFSQASQRLESGGLV